VLQEWPAAGPMTDYLTGLTQRYPKYYWVFICTAAVAGSTISPFLDTAHFQPWSFDNMIGTTPIPDQGGPTAWPTSPWPSAGNRAIFSQTTDTAQLEVTTTTVLNNFPLFPATITGLIAKMGAPNDSCNSFSDMTVQECAASGTFVYDWTFANRYDGIEPAYTAPATAPSTEQTPLVFPNVPAQRVVGWGPTYTWSGSNETIDSLFFISGTQPPALVTWASGAASLTFEFAAWSWNSAVEYEAIPFKEGPLASAPATVTQTIALGGASYGLSDVAADATALMNGTEFSAIAWGTSWTNRWSSSGEVISTQNVVASQSTGITESGAVGTPVKWGVAINGSPFEAGDFSYFMTQALVDICGNYCLRTYAEGTSGPVSCSNGNVNGFAPFTLSPPATPGQSVAAYNQGRS
jgi:hypothetical protein